MAQTEASAKVTTDHERIRRWVESRGGHPATVKRTSRGGEPGLLRIDYPGFSGARELKPISWEEFFEKFEESQLAFVYQDRTGSGRPSRFSKLVSRNTVSRRGGATRGRRTTAARGEQSAAARRQAKRKTGARSARRKSGGQRTARRASRTGTRMRRAR